MHAATMHVLRLGYSCVGLLAHALNSACGTGQVRARTPRRAAGGHEVQRLEADANGHTVRAEMHHTEPQDCE